jgi:hypothetical protein
MRSTMNHSRTKKVKIPASIVAELDALPRNRPAHNAVVFTEEMDAILLKGYSDETLQKKDFLAWWKKLYGHGSEGVLRKRFNELSARSDG